MMRRVYRGPYGLAALMIPAGMALSTIAWSQQAPPTPASETADQPRTLEDYVDWRALAIGAGNDRACYVTQKTVPTPPEGRAGDRPLLYVTHRPGSNAFGVVSYFAGYAVKPDSEIELDFGNARYRLFTQQGTNGAWSGGADVDGRIVEAMKLGASVTARGLDAAGAEVLDTFSLMGFTAALARITQECRGR